MEKKKDLLTTSEARSILSQSGRIISRTSVIAWVDKYDLGYKIGGRWYINKAKFNAFINKKPKKETSHEKIKLALAKINDFSA